MDGIRRDLLHEVVYFYRCNIEEDAHDYVWKAVPLSVFI